MMLVIGKGIMDGILVSFGFFWERSCLISMMFGVFFY